MTPETNFFHQDDLRREWDKRYTSNKGSEQLRDVMMEEYMKKKRMIKQQRNDREELEEFEKNYIEVEEFESSKGRYALLLVVLGLVGAFYFGGIRRSSSPVSDFEDSPFKEKKRDQKAKKEETSQSTDKVAASKGGSTGSKPKEEDQPKDRDESQAKAQDDDGDQKQGAAKKKSKKK